MYVLLQGYVEVIIYVSDVNDNSPEFTSSIFSGTIAENPPYDTQVIVVSINKKVS